MKTIYFLIISVLFFACTSNSGKINDSAPNVKAIDDVMQAFVDSGYIPGAVTMVVSKDKILHLGSVGVGDYETKSPMESDHLFWIASMTKPITAVALLMLQDEGKLSLVVRREFVPACHVSSLKLERGCAEAGPS